MIKFEDVLAAAQRLMGVAIKTPVLTSSGVDEMLGLRAYLKAENLQRTGSFKFRGAYNAVSALTPQERQRGIVAISAGNHAQAVALASRMHGCSSWIVMPHDVPDFKVKATKSHGGTVVVYDRFKEDREAIAVQLAATTGAALVHPYDDPYVMAGQGTACLELLEQCGDLDALIVGSSGGGFLAGCLVAARELCPSMQVFGSEPETADDIRRSLAEDRIIRIEPPSTICEGLQAQAMGRQPFEVLRGAVSMLTVPDATVVRAMRLAFDDLKVVLEPSGANALAALIEHRQLFKGQRVGIALSGGNIDLARFVMLTSSSGVKPQADHL